METGGSDGLGSAVRRRGGRGDAEILGVSTMERAGRDCVAASRGGGDGSEDSLTAKKKGGGRRMRSD